MGRALIITHSIMTAPWGVQDSPLGYFPVPLVDTLCVPPVALSVIVMVPVCCPAALGVKVTEIVQEAPATSVAGQVLVCMKTPGVSEIISIDTGSPGCFLLALGLDTFTVFGLL